MLDESICHFRGIGSILSFLFYFGWKILLANSVDPDQTPHYVASELDLHWLPIALYGFPGKNGLKETLALMQIGLKLNNLMKHKVYQNFNEFRLKLSKILNV